MAAEFRPEQVPIRARRLLPAQAACLPLAFTLGLASFGFLDSVMENPRLLWSFLSAAAALLAWSAVLFGSALRKGRTLTMEIALRKQHWVQACAHSLIFLYWGWYWRPVYDYAYLIGAQLALAYAFDMLLGWSRRDTYTFGFGPFPIIFSTNLFLWFRQDWFYLQFLMVAVGFAGKELIRWNKDGRFVHIFNPSSFSLTVFSLALILSGTSDITWGKEIAITQFYPPQMYLYLFLLPLAGQFFFGVTSMTMSAVVSTYLFGLVYFAATGTYYFFDSYIPIAVFLGMHLLFTDPSTSPRTELGRIIFGVAYGLSTVLLYELLGVAGLPTHYDKLLQVPILNLSIRGIDRMVRSGVLRKLDPAALGRSLAPRQRNLATIAIWTVVFAVLSAVEGVGDRHRGQSVLFWQQACNEDRPYACAYLASVESKLCDAGSGWACSQFAILQTELTVEGPGPVESLQAGCELGFLPACANLERTKRGVTALVSAPPTLEDFPIILRGSKAPITDRTPAGLYARACDQGWPDTCGR